MKRLLKKNRKSNLVLLSVLILVFSSCSMYGKNASEIKNIITSGDVEPPVLQEVQSVSSKQVRLVFNEEVLPYSDSFEPNSVEVEGYSLLVTLNQGIKPGKQVMLDVRVQDLKGNTTGISTPVWGYNENPAGIIINEFSTRGDGNNPDRTELFITKSGSLAGLVLYNGIPGNWDSMIMFDEVSVLQGDYVVVWWTEKLPSDVKNSSTVYNFCAKTSNHLPGYNGILTLAESPAQGAKVMDCVVYSNSSSTYEGYGSKATYERVSKACDEGWWKDLKKPVDSSNNTATRSMCRKTGTDCWYVCETKGSTFGSANTSAPFSL